MQMKIRILILTCFFSVVACVAYANNGTNGNGPQTDIGGGVVDADSKKPINNVNITAVSHDTKEKWMAVTDNNGNYSFNNIKGGAYKIVFQKDGFRKIIKEKIFIKEDENFQLNTEMSTNTEMQLIPGLLLFNFE